MADTTQVIEAAPPAGGATSTTDTQQPMWKIFLGKALGTGGGPSTLPVPTFAEDKPDYTLLVGGVVAIAALLAVLYFITKK